MKARSIVYWITTVLVAVVLLSSIVGVLKNPDAVAGMRQLGYPAYFLVIVSTWKVLGGIAILAPGFPRLKEWAYAGAIFDFTGAAISHASVGSPVGNIVAPLIIALIALASWALRPQSRRLGNVVPQTDPGVAAARVVATG